MTTLHVHSCNEPKKLRHFSSTPGNQKRWLMLATFLIGSTLFTYGPCSFTVYGRLDNAFVLYLVNYFICLFCLFVCLFVCLLGGFRSTQKFSLVWRRHHYRWKTAKFDFCPALMASEQWGFFIAAHILWQGTSVYSFHLQLPSVWQWSCHNLF